MAPMMVAAADRFRRGVAHQQRTLGRRESRPCPVQEVAGSDSDPNVARLTGSAEVLPLAGATGYRGATGPDPLVGRMGCYPGSPAGAEAAVVRGGNVDRRKLAPLSFPIRPSPQPD